MGNFQLLGNDDANVEARAPRDCRFYLHRIITYWYRSEGISISEFPSHLCAIIVAQCYQPQFDSIAMNKELGIAITESYTFRIIMIGERNVGKTEMVNAFMDRDVNPLSVTSDQWKSERRIQIEDEYVDVICMDPLPAANAYSTLIQNICRQMNAAIFIYDVNRIETLNNEWFDFKYDESEIFMIGNTRNSDDAAHSQIPADSVKRISESVNAAQCWEVSSKNEQKVKAVMGEIVRYLFVAEKRKQMPFYG